MLGFASTHEGRPVGGFCLFEAPGRVLQTGRGATNGQVAAPLAPESMLCLLGLVNGSAMQGLPNMNIGRGF